MFSAFSKNGYALSFKNTGLNMRPRSKAFMQSYPLRQLNKINNNQLASRAESVFLSTIPKRIDISKCVCF